MRGKDSAAPALALGQGITPAHAGKSIRSVLPRKCCRDHPRTCGEKSPNMPRNPQITGSPPHMRGKERGSTSRQRRNGITPAHAGKSRLCHPVGFFLWDHPRTCGEKSTAPGRPSTRIGSPPHMRGKAEVDITEWPQNRITPAHAGKSVSIIIAVLMVADHPRTCGEKFLEVVQPLAAWGSPPHMRGKVQIDRYKVAFVQDHPRTCGEKNHTGTGDLLRTGSPPHMRGKVLYGGYSTISLGDHPRTCGEKKSSIQFKLLQQGSPPHMRGKVAYKWLLVTFTGITPAHAGKSLQVCRETRRL